MEKKFKSKDLKISIVFTLIGIVASIFAGMYQIANLPENMKEQMISQLGSIEALLPIAAIQGGIIEELLLRLLVMSFFVLILWKLFANKNDYINIPNWVFILEEWISLFHISSWGNSHFYASYFHAYFILGRYLKEAKI